MSNGRIGYGYIMVAGFAESLIIDANFDSIT